MDGKLIFILLIEIVVLYVGFTVVDIQDLGLEFISRSTF